MDEKINNTVCFKSINKTKNNFHFELDMTRVSALISEIVIDWSQPVDLALTIRNACCELEEKYKITTIIQQIVSNDIEEIKKIKYFRIINYNNRYDFYNIACDVKDFPIAFMEGLGFGAIE